MATEYWVKCPCGCLLYHSRRRPPDFKAVACPKCGRTVQVDHSDVQRTR